VSVASAKSYANLHLTQTDNHGSTKGRMLFLSPNQQHQSTKSRSETKN